MLPPTLASQLARLGLGHVRREYPNKLDHVLTGSKDLIAPHALHPVFFGSFDWHSCVHTYWLLARLLRHYPTLPEADEVRTVFTTSFTEESMSVELAYFARPFSRTFERPYGWAWLLALAAELERHEHEAAERWSATLKPLVQAVTQRFLDYLPKATYPIRTGVHSNTAFALALALEYADGCHDGLATLVRSVGRRWYLDDVDYPAWEPSGEDFLSPCLIEAECMHRVLPSQEFADWFARFLPRLDRQEPRVLFQPVAVSDRSDGRIAHLDGLNLSRAWCWSSLATPLAQSDGRRGLMRDAAARHLAASRQHIAENYMGEHWLATFLLLALEAVE
ncbi:MAG: DUF2891 domain-containing protein [Acetobacteraceae bacterium]|nr:DUF2891 domain-containing protein [Acetobacteraceae bacterium]